MAHLLTAEGRGDWEEDPDREADSADDWWEDFDPQSEDDARPLDCWDDWDPPDEDEEFPWYAEIDDEE